MELSPSLSLSFMTLIYIIHLGQEYHIGNFVFFLVLISGETHYQLSCYYEYDVNFDHLVKSDVCQVLPL